MKISEENISEIAEWLDMGMICAYHQPTETVEYHPDPLSAYFDPELWDEVMDKIDSDMENYIRFEGMESRQAFRVMEDFANAIPDLRFKSRLFDELSRPKPFRNFKFAVDNSEYREDWFAFKHEAFKDWVKKQIEYMEK